MRYLIILLSLLALPAHADLQAGFAELAAGHPAEARATFRTEFAKGSGEAAYMLGYMDQNGVGQNRPHGPQAEYWYHQAADLGYTRADLALAQMYLAGDVVPMNYGLARDWLERAAHDGYQLAQYQLARLYEGGFGGPRSAVWAYAWYDVAAAGGNTAAAPARDRIARSLAPDKLTEAQHLVSIIYPRIVSN